MALANKNQASARSVVPALPEELSLYLKCPPYGFRGQSYKILDRHGERFSTSVQDRFKIFERSSNFGPCKRLFFKAGNIMTEKINRLKGQKLHMQIFLNEVDRSLW